MPYPVALWTLQQKESTILKRSSDDPIQKALQASKGLESDHQRLWVKTRPHIHLIETWWKWENDINTGQLNNVWKLFTLSKKKSWWKIYNCNKVKCYHFNTGCIQETPKSNIQSCSQVDESPGKALLLNASVYITLEDITQFLKTQLFLFSRILQKNSER